MLVSIQIRGKRENNKEKEHVEAGIMVPSK